MRKEEDGYMPRRQISEESTPWTSWCQISSNQNCEKVSLCCLSHPVCGICYSSTSKPIHLVTGSTYHLHSFQQCIWVLVGPHHLQTWFCQSYSLIILQWGVYMTFHTSRLKFLTVYFTSNNSVICHIFYAANSFNFSYCNACAVGFLC